MVFIVSISCFSNAGAGYICPFLPSLERPSSPKPLGRTESDSPGTIHYRTWQVVRVTVVHLADSDLSGPGPGPASCDGVSLAIYVHWCNLFANEKYDLKHIRISFLEHGMHCFQDVSMNFLHSHLHSKHTLLRWHRMLGPDLINELEMENAIAAYLRLEDVNDNVFVCYNDPNWYIIWSRIPDGGTQEPISY